jgi:mannose-6-phosphate isomerase-like protein (cupin superfamily)
MDGFIDNIEDATVENPNSRHVLYSGKHLQLVLISLGPGQETGVAVHDEGDQFLRIEVGQGVVTIDARESEITEGDGIVIPAGARHNLKSTGEKPLKLWSLYAPPRYSESHVAATLDDAEALPEKFDGTTTE